MPDNVEYQHKDHRRKPTIDPISFSVGFRRRTKTYNRNIIVTLYLRYGLPYVTLYLHRDFTGTCSREYMHLNARSMALSSAFYR